MAILEMMMMGNEAEDAVRPQHARVDCICNVLAAQFRGCDDDYGHR